VIGIGLDKYTVEFGVKLVLCIFEFKGHRLKVHILGRERGISIGKMQVHRKRQREEFLLNN